MKLSKERQGELYIFFEAMFWGLFPVITILSYNKFSPLVSLFWSTLFAAAFFAIVLTVKKKWYEIKDTSALKDILILTFFNGILFYLLNFFGLQNASAGNVSILLLTQILTSYIFFHVLRRDYIPKTHIIGAVLMVAGALVILLPKMQSFRGGEYLIILSTIIAPIGNFFTQKARKKVDSSCIMFIRSFVSLIFFLLLILIFNNKLSLPDLKNSYVYLIINGVFILGLSKVFWIEGIHRISVVKANSLETFSPLFALFFAWVLLGNIPTSFQLLSFIPMFFGVMLLSRQTKQI